MTDYIKRQDAVKACGGYMVPANIIRHLPSAPVREVVTGEWIDITNDESLDVEYKCSNCGFELFLWSKLTNYCPNCGADMRSTNVHH